MDRRSFFRWVSIIGHPFVLLLVYVLAGVSAFLPWTQALIATGIVLVVAILPMTLFIQRQVRGGKTNFDVSAQELRGPIYGLGLVLGVLLWIVFHQLGAPQKLLLPLVVGIAMVIVASLINLRLKVSLHSAFSVWVAAGLWQIHPRLGLALGLFAGVVAWSRLALDRHSKAEVLAGLLLGAIMALPLFFV